MKWLGTSVASVAFGLPAIAFVVALVAVDGHAGVAYYEAIAQIIPIVILTLAIELRYFSPGREPPRVLGVLFRDPARMRLVAAGYAAATLLALVLSEAVALWVLADGKAGAGSIVDVPAELRASVRRLLENAPDRASSAARQATI